MSALSRADARVCVHGLGQVGLPTALLLAGTYEVVGVDVDPERVAALESGELPFSEPGLDDLFGAADFSARETPVEADVHVVATPTPLERTTNVADLTQVRAAIDGVSQVARDGDCVVLESTVPPGTTERLVAPLATRAAAVEVAYSPERAIPGDTVAEMRQNDRVVGTATEGAAEPALALYESFVEGEVRVTDATTAEFVKLAENTHRDVNIALANEFAKLAGDADVDVHEAIDLANHHPRVDLLTPGPGVGGHCITIDPWFLTETAPHARLIPAARGVNDTMPDHLFTLVRETLADPVDARLAVLGVAYKGDIGDTRETPAHRFVRRALNDGHEIRVHDPHVTEFDPTPVALEDAVDGADCLVVVTGHDAFLELDPARLAERMATPRLVDGRNLLDHHAYREAGFEVSVLGGAR